MTKECEACKKVKDVNHFTRNRTRKSGFSRMCRMCFREWSKHKRRTDPLFQG